MVRPQNLRSRPLPARVHSDATSFLRVVAYHKDHEVRQSLHEAGRYHLFLCGVRDVEFDGDVDVRRLVFYQRLAEIGQASWLSFFGIPRDLPLVEDLVRYGWGFRIPAWVPDVFFVEDRGRFRTQLACRILRQGCRAWMRSLVLSLSHVLVELKVLAVDVVAELSWETYQWRWHCSLCRAAAVGGACGSLHGDGFVLLSLLPMAKPGAEGFYCKVHSVCS